MAVAAALFLLNLWIAWPLCTVEYTRHLQSNEGSLIAMAQAFHERREAIFWWPLWNAGLPSPYTYAPLLPAVTAAVVAATGWSAALAFHGTTGVLFALGAPALALLAWMLSGSVWRAAAAGLLWTLLSPSTLLVPGAWAETGGLLSRRIHNTLYYGEAAHVAAISLLPVVVLCLLLAWKRSRWFWAAAGAAALASALFNAFGGAALAMAVLTMAVVWRRGLALLVFGAAVYAVASPLLPPALLGTIAANSRNIGAVYTFGPLWWAAAAAVLAVLFALDAWLRRRGALEGVRFAALLAWLSGSITLLSFVGVEILFQSHRYQHEMDLALTLLAALTLPWRKSLALAAVPLLGWQAWRIHEQTRAMAEPIDIRSTMEFRASRVLEERFGERRVMASGSLAYWLNVFTRVPQLSGGHDPTAINFQQRIAVFTIHGIMNPPDRDAAYSILWLKAFGAHAVVTHGERSAAFWKPFRDPRKFDGVLPLVWREGDDAIYAVPQRSGGLAHVVPADALVRRPPRNGLDTAEVERYVRALEDASLPVPQATWPDWGHGRIRATLAPGQVVSVQVNHHAGWRAAVNGKAARVFADGIGLMAIAPECVGECWVELRF